MPGRLAAPALLVVISAAPFLNSLAGPWLLDDVALVARNPFVQRPELWGRLWTADYWASTGAQSGLYRPATMTSFALNYLVAGNASWAFHAVNIALHAACTLLVWWVLCRGRRGGWAAFAAAALFAAHPIHAEAVANVAGRSELLVAVGFLCAVWTHGFPRGARRPPGETSWAWRDTVSLAGYGAALFVMVFSKENGLVLLGWFVVADVGARRWRIPGGRRRLFANWLIAAGVAGIYLALRSQSVTGGFLATDNLGAWGRMELSASAAAKNLRMLILPWHQQAVWPLPSPGSLPWPVVAVGLVVLAAIPTLVLLAAWRASPTRLACALVAFGFVPLVHLVPNVIWVWERGLYVPSTGLAWLVFLGLRQTPARVWAIPVVVVVLAAGWRTAQMSCLYADDLRFWEYQAASNPRDANSALSLSEALLRHHRGDDALVMRKTAYALAPDRGAVVMATVDLLLRRGATSEARDLLKAAAAETPQFNTPAQTAQGLRALASMATRAGMPTEADHFTSAAISVARDEPSR